MAEHIPEMLAVLLAAALILYIMGRKKNPFKVQTKKPPKLTAQQVAGIKFKMFLIVFKIRQLPIIRPADHAQQWHDLYSELLRLHAEAQGEVSMWEVGMPRTAKLAREEHERLIDAVEMSSIKLARRDQAIDAYKTPVLKDDLLNPMAKERTWNRNQLGTPGIDINKDDGRTNELGQVCDDFPVFSFERISREDRMMEQQALPVKPEAVQFYQQQDLLPGAPERLQLPGGIAPPESRRTIIPPAPEPPKIIIPPAPTTVLSAAETFVPTVEEIVEIRKTLPPPPSPIIEPPRRTAGPPTTRPTKSPPRPTRPPINLPVLESDLTDICPPIPDLPDIEITLEFEADDLVEVIAPDAPGYDDPNEKVVPDLRDHYEKDTTAPEQPSNKKKRRSRREPRHRR